MNKLLQLIMCILTLELCKPNFLQKFLIYIGQNSFLKRGLFRYRYSKLIFSIKKGPLDIYFKKCAFRLFGENNLIEYGILLDPKYNSIRYRVSFRRIKFRIKFCRFRFKYWPVLSTFSFS